MSSIKISGLTGLRWLACLSVIVYHTNQLRLVDSLPTLTWDIYLFIQTATVAVSFFFIIGGMYRSMPYWRSILLDAPMPETRTTLLHRFFRIAPAYYWALIGSFLFAAMVGRLWEHAWVQLFAGLAFLSWIHPITFFPVDINGPLWFISYDMMGTLMIIALMLSLRKMRKKYIPLGIFVCAGILLGFHFLFISLPFPPVDGVASALFPTYNPFLFGLHFLFGVTLAWLFVRFGNEIAQRRWYYDILAIVFAVWLEIFFWHMRESWDLEGSWPAGPYLFPTVQIFLAIIIFSLSRSVKVGQWLDNAIFSWVAKVSYGMYLWHMLVVIILHGLLFGSRDLLMNEWIILLSVSLPISLAVSWLSWRWLEIGFGDWRKKWISKT